MDVSNASGYDGCTVAADACFVAKHTSDRAKIVLAETLNPQVRQVVKTYAPGFGLEVAEVPHRGGTIDPDELAAASADAAAVIFQQPNFFGCLEPAPDLAAAAKEAGAHAIAHVDLMSLGLLEAPGEYGCAMAIGEGQSVGCPPLYGGPHYGFFAARQDFVRRMPGRIVGETVDLDGERAFVLTLQTREQHIRREKATSNITTNQTLLALAGLVTLAWLGPQGLREVGETCVALTEYAKERLDLPLAFERPTFNEVAVRLPRAGARRHPRRARSVASIPATRSAVTTQEWTTCCSSRSRRSGPRRTSTGWPPCSGGVLMELIFEKSRCRPAAPAACPTTASPSPSFRRASPRASAAAAGGRGARDRPAHHGARRPHVRHRHGLLSARQLHDEAQPARQRARRAAARIPRPAPAPGGRRRAGRARAHVATCRGSSPRSRAFRR